MKSIVTATVSQSHFSCSTATLYDPALVSLQHCIITLPLYPCNTVLPCPCVSATLYNPTPVSLQYFITLPVSLQHCTLSHLNTVCPQHCTVVYLRISFLACRQGSPHCCSWHKSSTPAFVTLLPQVESSLSRDAPSQSCTLIIWHHRGFEMYIYL